MGGGKVGPKLGRGEDSGLLALGEQGENELSGLVQRAIGLSEVGEGAGEYERYEREEATIDGRQGDGSDSEGLGDGKGLRVLECATLKMNTERGGGKGPPLQDQLQWAWSHRLGARSAKLGEALVGPRTLRTAC